MQVSRRYSDDSPYEVSIYSLQQLKTDYKALLAIIRTYAEKEAFIARLLVPFVPKSFNSELVMTFCNGVNRTCPVMIKYFVAMGHILKFHSARSDLCNSRAFTQWDREFSISLHFLHAYKN